uniref:uncharacterized protein LOC101296124 isoform X1 n=1 Tax=Fragaria vesca subsp. vesca TaxID=101020 RepID=UPI0005CAF1AB|nr:PREDICTED: uncharacterized protein LOC101296124 isoform X1 [Fragaria vesca subsp. vesca]XP_011467557.1 PREDICTED: uncharacterized protein LOC101296124 isoform X1 [Fragaria vesca subsp. vesca]
MESYRRVKKPKPKPELPLSENEVRITTQGSIRKYLNYVTTQLQDKQVSEIVLKAMGQAIIKTVAIAEIIKRKVLYTLELNIITNRRQFNEYWDFVQISGLGYQTLQFPATQSINRKAWLLQPQQL